MIFDIHTSRITGEICFVEAHDDYSACDLIDLLFDCGFDNARLGCWASIDNCIVFTKD